MFLTLEDETGIANIIVRPDLYSEQRATIVGEPYLLVEGTLQIQAEGVTSIKAERVQLLGLSLLTSIDSREMRISDKPHLAMRGLAASGGQVCVG